MDTLALTHACDVYREMSNLREDMIRIAGYEQVPIQAIADWHQYVRNNMPWIEEDNVQNVVDRILNGYGLGDSDDEYGNAEDYNDELREEDGEEAEGEGARWTSEHEEGLSVLLGPAVPPEGGDGSDDDNIRNGNWDGEGGLGAPDDPEECAPDTITLIVEGRSVRYVREDIVLSQVENSDYQRGRM